MNNNENEESLQIINSNPNRIKLESVIFKSTNAKYTGEWISGLRDGHGIQEYQNGAK